MQPHAILLAVFLHCSVLSFGQDKPTTAPEFKFTTLEGQSSQLSDYKDKVLYVSFWASWCKPCLVNFKKYKTMRHQMAEADVILLNVNIDKSEESWRKAVATHSIDGVHVRGNDLDTLQELYKLYSIPSYEIINKKGELVYLSDDPDRNIIAEFKQWVNE